jgi:DNA modification methylase
MRKPIENHGVTEVYDPFVGSGTTIIACEQLGRKCRAMEIDPGYVAVSIQRWADATGKTPKLLTSFPNKGKDAEKRK